MSFQELKRYHEELIQQLRSVQDFVEHYQAGEVLRKTTNELEAALHAARAKLPDARLEQG